MDLNKELVFIEYEGLDACSYGDWDEYNGYGGTDQIVLEGKGIVVHKSRENDFRKNLENFKSWDEE